MSKEPTPEEIKKPITLLLDSQKEDNMTAFLADEFRKAGFEPYPTKKLGFWRNLWQNKIRRKETKQ